MPLVFARMIVIVAVQREAAEHALHPESLSAFAHLAGFGLVTAIDPVSRLLEQPADQLIGRFENRRAHQRFQLGDQLRSRGLGLELGNQALDFLILGEEDVGGNVFFFEAAML